MDKYTIDDLLFEELILTDLQADDCESLIRKMAMLAHERGYVDSDYAEAVIERERLYPTGLPTNVVKVAIPHPMVQHSVKKSSIIICKLNNPVPFREMGSIDHRMIPVDMVFMLAVNGSKNQLIILQELVSIFSEDSLMNRIKSASTAQEMLKVLKDILST